MQPSTLSPSAVPRREFWVREVAVLSGQFGEDTTRLSAELDGEIARDGEVAILDHLRLCGAIPEHYGHDSSEEKLYSKYTDMVLAASFRQIGLIAIVLSERGDAADVEAVAPNYGLVADAKAFRLSRTAKNQKDFKIEAMHGWKRGKPHAIVICPSYQLPRRSSQIYQQAIARHVTILSYSHLAVLVRLAGRLGAKVTVDALLEVMRCAETLNPTKDATIYWSLLNRTMIAVATCVRELWQEEKVANLDALRISKEEALSVFASQREAIMRLNHEQAIQQLISDRNLDGRERVVRAIADNGILLLT